MHADANNAKNHGYTYYIKSSMLPYKHVCNVHTHHHVHYLWWNICAQMATQLCLLLALIYVHNERGSASAPHIIQEILSRTEVLANFSLFTYCSCSCVLFKRTLDFVVHVCTCNLSCGCCCLANPSINKKESKRRKKRCYGITWKK